MADNKEREFEKRWQETGALEDEVAFLMSRVRSDSLTAEQADRAGEIYLADKCHIGLGIAALKRFQGVISKKSPNI